MRFLQNIEILTILFMPLLASDNMRRLNRQAASVQPEALVPNEVNEVGGNSRKDILVIDVKLVSALARLRGYGT